MNLTKKIILFCVILLLGACADYKTDKPKHAKERKFYSSKGFALIYSDSLFEQGGIDKKLNNNDTIVVDGGSIMNYVMQTFIIKKEQRIISSTGVELSGFAIPAAVGCALANSKTNTICLCEDLGFQINNQVLEIIRENDLPIKIIVFSSVGYSSIRKIQREYFGGRYIGTINKLSKAPDLLKIGKTYGFETCEISNGSTILISDSNSA